MRTTMSTAVILFVAAQLLGGCAHHNKSADKDGKALPVAIYLARTEPAPNAIEVYQPGSNIPLFMNREAQLTQQDIVAASLESDHAGRPMILLTFTEAGSSRIEQLTRAHLGQVLVIVVDGDILAMPTIQDVVTRQAVIAGGPQLDTQVAQKALQVINAHAGK